MTRKPSDGPDLTRCVDAAARAWHDRWQSQRRDDGRLRPDGKPWDFDDLTPIDQHALRSFVLPIVTAVADELADLIALARLTEFAEWVARNRAYNGSPHEHGQSLYNECLNAVLPTWADEWLRGGEGQ